MSRAIKRNTEALQTFFNNKRNRIPKPPELKFKTYLIYTQIVRSPNSPQQTI